jgi:NRAMP (natural resistance-associated macrophage protein)-like metal ion transporter
VKTPERSLTIDNKIQSHIMLKNGTESSTPSTMDRRKSFLKLLSFFKIFGPGFIVMIADMDAGSIVTAGVSGADWGYKLILWQVLLIYPLYLVQSITARLGCVSSKGHGELIREHYGNFWGAFATAILSFVVFASLLTEFIGIAAAGDIFNAPKYLSVGVSLLILIFVALSGSYKKAENIALIFALSGFVFIPAAIAARPNLHDLVIQGIFGSQPILNQNYLWLIAANAGAVIMPWMIYYQQSATVDKGLCPKDIKETKIDTLIGSIATQVLMIAVIALTAATLYPHHIVPSTAKSLAASLIPLAGKYAGYFFCAGLYTSSFLAAFVVSMAFSWAATETWGGSHSLNDKFQDARSFYIIYILFLVISAAIVLIPGIPLVRIMVDVEAFNGFALPVVLAFLIVLASNKKILGEYAYSKKTLTFIAFLGIVIVVLGVLTSVPPSWIKIL